MFNQFGFTQFDLLFMYIVPEFCSFLLPSFHNISLLICVVPGLRKGEDTSTRWRKAKYFSDLSLGTDHMEHYDTKQILKVIWKDVRSWKGTHPPKADPWVSSPSLIKKYSLGFQETHFRYTAHNATPWIYSFCCGQNPYFPWLSRDKISIVIIPYQNSHFKNFLHVFTCHQMPHTSVPSATFYLYSYSSQPMNFFEELSVYIPDFPSTSQVNPIYSLKF